MLEAAGQREQALAAYRESLAIGEKLAADPGNAEWQRDLSISLERIGAVALKTGKRAEGGRSVAPGARERKLNADQRGWIALIGQELAKLPR